MTNEKHPHEELYGQYGGFATRLVAWIIDQLIVGAILAVYAWVLTFVLDTVAINEILGLQGWANAIILITVVVGAVVIAFSYHVGLWLLAGQTPGKQVMGLRIVRTDGRRLTFWSATIRWLGYAISAILFLGYLWVLVDNKRQAFHDKLARTLVIYAWPEKDEWEIEATKEHLERRREKRRMESRRTRAAD